LRNCNDGWSASLYDCVAVDIRVREEAVGLSALGSNLDIDLISVVESEGRLLNEGTHGSLARNRRCGAVGVSDVSAVDNSGPSSVSRSSLSLYDVLVNNSSSGKSWLRPANHDHAV
jgi:hypothetical protein